MSKQVLNPAVVMGDLNLLRCLGRMGIPTFYAVSKPQPAAWSRYARRVVHLPDPENLGQHQAVADALMAIPWPDGVQPSLFYGNDWDVLVISRHRERLAQRYRFIIPPADLVTNTVDKEGFLSLAQSRGLPVPHTQIIQPGADMDRQLDAWNCFPCIVKPSLRNRWFGSALSFLDGAAGLAKALRLESRADLERLRPMLSLHHTGLIFQEYVEGGDDRLVSFHAYIRPNGECVASFTGKKIRTFPRTTGWSSYLELTDDDRVRKLGLGVVERLGFHGVLKIDFKEDSRSGQLHLLEINPRFSLWHYPAGVVGANIPALVYRDLYGLDWDLPTQTPPGMRWLSLFKDMRAFREQRRTGDLTLASWLRSLGAPSVYDSFAWNDPLPVLGAYWVRITDRAAKRQKSAASPSKSAV